LQKKIENILRLTKRKNMPTFEGLSKDKFNGYLYLKELFKTRTKDKSHML